MKRRFFVSCSVYALAHQFGMKGAIADVRRQLDAPSPMSLPFVRTIARLRMLDVEMQLHVDGGATYIGMARSRAFHEAHKSGLPWISLDDDIEVTTDCAAAMVDVLDDEVVPRVVLVPYLTRDEEDARLTITLPIVRTERVRNGAKLLLMPKGTGGGFGMVGMNRLAIEAVQQFAPPDLTWFDMGEKKLAIFYERLEDGLWYGEDTSFFKYRVPPEVTVEALLTGAVTHGGIPLKLDGL